MKFSKMEYKRLDLEEVKKEFEELTKRLKEAKSGEEQFQVHQDYYKLTDRIHTLTIIAQIRHDIDTTDEFYDKEQEHNDKISPEIEKLTIQYLKVLYESPYRDYLESKIGKVAFKSMELKFKAFDESLIPLIQEENKLTSQYDKLIASAKIDWEGETLNLSLLGKYLSHEDREIRKKAYDKYCEFFEENKEELDAIYDKLVKNRTEQGKKLGYENFIPLGYYRMNRTDYDQSMVENFRNQIKKYFVPFAEKVHEKRRKTLGIDQLAYYDTGVYFKNGNPAPIGTPEEIMVGGTKMYSELSEETKEFIHFLVENELFDVLGRKNKKAGGYMEFLPLYNAPYVFANFNGTSGDIDVITHECGHAFQGYLSGKDPIREHADITMETAEIHSMSMEFFTAPWMDSFFGDRTEDYLYMHFASAVAFIPYGCMVDEFQHIVYQNPEMSPEERNQVWLKLEKEYRPHMNYEGSKFFESGRFWQKQLHIYDLPFYYIDYCLAQTCAFQYKIKMDEDYKSAWESYYKLCKLSASGFYTEMLKEVGLKVPFEDGFVEELVKQLEAKIEL